MVDRTAAQATQQNRNRLSLPPAILLDDHPVMRALWGAPERLDRLKAAIEIKHVREGEVIFQQGDLGDAVFLVLAGRVDTFKRAHDGTDVPIAAQTSGQYFGDYSVRDKQPRIGRAVAMEDSTLARIPSDAFLDTLWGKDARPFGEMFDDRLLHDFRRATKMFLEERETRAQEVIDARFAEIGIQVTSLTHDIGNHLANIRGFAELLQLANGEAHLDREMVEQGTNQIMSSIDYLARLCKHTLLVASGSSLMGSTAPLAIPHLFEQFRQRNVACLKLQNTRLHLEPIDATIIADEPNLLRVLENLTHNAAKVMSELGGEIFISAEYRPDDTPPSVCIKVRDSGPGIPDSLRDRLFEPFSTEGKHKGTGLGLYIVQSIVKAHGGTISFESSSQGTVFSIVLPVGSESVAP